MYVLLLNSACRQDAAILVTAEVNAVRKAQIDHYFVVKCVLRHTSYVNIRHKDVSSNILIVFYLFW